MHTLYDPDMYDASRPVSSYWEADAPVNQLPYTPLARDHQCDVAVIGAGYTGVSAALHLARDHHVDVRVLDAGPIGWGASGRNGGFCCLAATKLGGAEMIRRFGLDETRRFYRAQLEGIRLVARLGDEEGIDMEVSGEAVLTVAYRPEHLAALEQEARVLTELCDVRTRLFERGEIAECGYRARGQFGALAVSPGFALHPLKFIAGLARAAQAHGAHLHPMSPVLDWQRESGRHVLITPGARVHARRVVIATNGFTPEGLHPALDGAVLPVISNIVVTRPLSTEELERHAWRTRNPISNTRHLLNYYRLLPDDRFLFGARGDTFGSPAAGRRMRRRMERELRRMFPDWSSIPVTHYWRGFVCVTRRLIPYLGRLENEPSVWYGLGYHGNGVNTAPWVGKMLAAGITDARVDGWDRELPSFMAGPMAKFPLPGWRLWALRGAILYYRFRDAMAVPGARLP